jgi:ligand-binding sensor domain-containing protein/signal transduction histidine kinase
LTNSPKDLKNGIFVTYRLLMRRFSYFKCLCTVLAMFALSWVNGQDIRDNYTHYSTENGLQTDYYQGLFQDSYGYLWLATYDGLLKWDGYTFKRYAHQEKDPSSLRDNIVYTIFEDASRRLWIGTIGGLDMYDRGMDGFVHCNLHHVGERVPVNAITEDRAHRLWLGTSMGLCMYEAKTGSAQWAVSSEAKDDMMYCVGLDKVGNVWAGTFDKGLVRYNPRTNEIRRFSTVTGLCSNKIRCMLLDREGRIWVGSVDRGINVLDTGGKVLRVYDRFFSSPTGPEPSITCLYQDKKGTIWIGTRRDVPYYLKEGMQAPVPMVTREPMLSINAIQEDSFGNQWFASDTHGLYCTNRNKNAFRNYSSETNLKGDGRFPTISAIGQFRNHIWMGTGSAGMMQFNPPQGLERLPMLGSVAVNDMTEDKDGNLWVGTWSGGLKRVDARSGQVRSFLCNPRDDHSLVNNDVTSVVADDSLLWIGTQGDGLAAYDLVHGGFISYKNNERFPFDLREPAWITCLFKDRQHRLWIGTYSGIYLFDGKRLLHMEHTLDSGSLSNNTVNMITQDAMGNIWIVGEGGLDKYEEEGSRFLRFNNRGGLPTVMKALIAGRDGRLWISTNQGILSFDPQTLESKIYDSNDGLNQSAFLAKSVWKDGWGNLFFGGTKGIVQFNPDSIKAVNLPTYFYFTSLYINDELQRPGDKGSALKKDLGSIDTLTLDYKKLFFSIGFTSVNLYAPQKARYSYWVDGLNDSWINVGSDRKIPFTSPQPGNYVIRIRYTDVQGKWHTAPKAFYLVILPPWWQTAWCKVLAIMMGIAAIAGAFYLRVSSIKARNRFLSAQVQSQTKALRQTNHMLEESNQTKDHFFSILAHDLKNPVGSLLNVSEFMKENLSRIERKVMQDYLDSMHASTASVYELLENLLNWARTQSKKIKCSPTDWDLEVLILKNVRLQEASFSAKNLKVQVHLDPERGVHADMDMMDTVIRNLLSNAVKFTGYGGTISIHSEGDNDQVTLSISDTGVGMTALQVENLFLLTQTDKTLGTAGERGTGLGLVISREFVELNQGKIWVESTPGVGSMFALSLPKSMVQVKSSNTALSLSRWAPDLKDTLSEDTLLKIRGRKILVVDDNKEIRDYMKLVLAGIFDITEAGDGAEGLKKVLDSAPDYRFAYAWNEWASVLHRNQRTS